ncbi:MAG: PEGA domain-containing protein [Alphaproteobacteria bacterium]|nr:PEGA domain-containing protein [Alphaproteobacteria bacterium]
MKKFLLLLPILLSACGTIFSGSTQTISFDSNVKDVKVYVNGQQVCNQVPCSVDVDRASSPLIVMAKREGYKDGMANIKSKINSTAWFNILWLYGSFSAATTDYAMGGLWKYTQDGVYINMEPEKLKHAERQKFSQESQIRAFSLYNYKDLRIEAATGENGEYMQTLSYMTGLSPEELRPMVMKSKTEVSLAHNLTGIR